MTKILGDNNGAIKTTLVDAFKGGGFIGESPFHGVILLEGVGDLVADIEVLADDSGTLVFINYGDRNVFGVIVRIPVGVDIEPSVDTGNKNYAKNNEYCHFAFG